MPLLRTSLTRLSLTALLITAAALPAPAQSDTPEKGAAAWDDFIHYVLIALPNRAVGHGEYLLEMVGDDDLRLLRYAEEGRPDYERTLVLASKIEAVADVAAQLSEKIQNAKIQLIRDPKRMAADVRRLTEGGRARSNALARLKEAGQFAAPLLLDVLLSERAEDRQLHPHVMTAIVAIGRPLVHPLSVALPQLEPVQLGQVAQMLTAIGYPRAAPPIKQVLETVDVDQVARAKVQRAYDLIAAKVRLPANVTAAELYLTLGENIYTAATRGGFENVPGYDPKTDKGIVWAYDAQAGLVHTPVPPSVYGDVLAMRAAQAALRLNPNMNRALSLWLMANLRRENRLPDDQIDPSYGRNMRPPQFYIEMAGPLRQHDVLQKALEDADVALALDAILALDATAGTEALVNQQGAMQPLLSALSYPDRHVRFAAAFALTQARPQLQFPGSFRIVPILTEAVRQAGTRHALVIARDTDSRNQLVSAIEALDGFGALGGLSISDPQLVDLIRSGPGVDVIVTNLSYDQCVGLLSSTASDYHLAGAPILAVVPRGDQIELERMLPNSTRLFWVDPQPQDLAASIEKAIQGTAGESISEGQADQYAKKAIELLRQIAVSRGDVFNVSEAQPALIAALNDTREFVVQHAGQVLALLNDASAQQSLCEAAIDQTRSIDVRISLLNSLAESARHFGDLLTETLTEQMLELVMTSEDDLAIAAARAHGALALPTSHLKRMIE